MALDENKYDHLVELGGSDYEIVDGEPNIKGWDVKNNDGQKIGEVDELLFDPQSRKVRYLIVDLDDNELDLGTDKKVLIPIGVADLYDGKETERTGGAYAETKTAFIEGESDIDLEKERYNAEEDGEIVIVPATAEQLRELPAYEKNNVTPETESTIRQIFEGMGAAGAVAAYSKNEFYDHDHFNEDKFYDKGSAATSSLPVIEESLEIGKRDVETGGARITSRIVERPVQENINLREENVTIERTPVNRPVSADDTSAFKETEFEMIGHAEVPVVTKEARVVEEISLNKEVTEKEETIKETLRNTEVNTERINSKKD